MYFKVYTKDTYNLKVNIVGMLFLCFLHKNIYMQDLEIRNRIAVNLKNLRKQKKLTQFELAEKANLSEGAIKRIELAISYPEEKTLSQITEALDVDVVKLFMPIGNSFKTDKSNTIQLKSAIADNVRDYINEILKDFI